MTSQKKLHGIVLIDCARANASQGIQEAAAQCGYGDNIDIFLQELSKACHDAGIRFETFDDLAEPSSSAANSTGTGVEIAPETSSEL